MLNERQIRLFDYIKEVKISTVATVAHMLNYRIVPTEHNYTNAPRLYLDIRAINDDPDAPGIIIVDEGYIRLAMVIEDVAEYAQNKMDRALKLLKTYHALMRKLELINQVSVDIDTGEFSVKDYGCIPAKEMEEMINELEGTQFVLDDDEEE